MKRRAPMNSEKARFRRSQSLNERLRQQKQTFEQNKTQKDRWFMLRLRMAYTAILLLFAIATLCGYIVLNHQLFSEAITDVATAALLGDVLGLTILIWKTVFTAPGTPPKYL
jgi:polyferredoxin